jgi:hypothetical protein
MLLFALIISVPVLVFVVIGLADRRWPDRLSRRGRHLMGGRMDPNARRESGPGPQGRRTLAATSLAERRLGGTSKMSSAYILAATDSFLAQPPRTARRR